MRLHAVLFDLGNTLVAYYRKEEFAPVLASAVAAAIDLLEKHGIVTLHFDAAMQAALAENRESPDHRFSPLLPRLRRIFRLQADLPPVVTLALTDAFMRPIFDTAKLYDDAIPALKELRSRGLKTVIVSNSPWGSAPALWRQELDRHGLLPLIDAAVFCGDVGWRKPALQIFRHAAALIAESPEHCLFVGDDPEWDIRGSKAAGMRPVLIDRSALHHDYVGNKITSLTELHEGKIGAQLI
jgi:putative hydrolase of the HAD superfamily